jgi:GDPmannose 4,6-dehydratase
MSKTALILGIGGQDGSYLADILIEKGYEVHGMVRRSSVDNLVRLQHLLDKVSIHRGDLTDYGSLYRIIGDIAPDEIYNEADQDAVGWSRSVPSYNYSVTFSAVGNLLEIILKLLPKARVFQPVSATMFTGSPFPQDENTILTPQSPYACAKAGAYLLCKYYRTLGLHISTGILYNHDSPRRSEEYLVHKICKSVLRMKQGKQHEILLGNLYHVVDIGHAKEFMEAVWSIVQLDHPDDFVIATGHPITIQELVLSAFDTVGINEIERIGIDKEFTPKSGRIEPPLVGDITKARNILGFNPILSGEHLIRTIIKEMQ